MNKKERKLRRHKRIRENVRGSEKLPRLSMYRSNKGLYIQLIDDDKGVTLVGVSEKHLGKDIKGKKTEIAKKLGLLIAEKAKEKKIHAVVFDRSGYAYHGRVQQIAEGAREGGLKF